MKRVLVTANKDLAAPLIQDENIKGEKLHLLPLEFYENFTFDGEREVIAENLDEYSFIIYGNLRNARHFIEWVKENELVKDAQTSVNLTLDKPAMQFVEANGIPAIMPKNNGKPIDILEFMLRIFKEGKTLYPTTRDQSEEIPGLLKELDMPVDEFTVCREIRVNELLLKSYMKKIKQKPVNTVLFHNRSSVIRTLTAFPGLNYSELTLIAGSEGAAQKMKEEGLAVHEKASGSWQSIASVLTG